MPFFFKILQFIVKVLLSKAKVESNYLAVNILWQHRLLSAE